jgi:hypothetical protein
MNYYIYSKEKYERIISVLCEVKGLRREELIKLLKDKQCKYLMFLLFKKYQCVDSGKLKIDFSIQSKKSINTTCKRAEELFLINRQFRELYFKMEELIENKKTI